MSELLAAPLLLPSLLLGAAHAAPAAPQGDAGAPVLERGAIVAVADAPQLPPGFVAELVVAHPVVKWPSAVHVREDGALLVGEDPMDMPGPSDQPIDKLWLLKIADDGTWTKTLFCDRLFAVMGIQEIDDAIFVMNMPHLTVLRDRDGDGVAEERKELLTDLGPNAPGWPGGFNDHIVTGLRLGMDGWLYVSVGDKGVPGAHGTDGSTIQLRGGGVVRLRPDGSELEVVASGTRNHLDVALDERDTIFTYDNTDDGLGWWTRFTHVMPTGCYGYPWDYHDHPERMLPCMRDDGGGSGVGALVYREAAWPEEWRGAVYCCDWADMAIRKYVVEPDGATWKCSGVSDFMTPGKSGEFRPLDLAESPDGRWLYVADWNHGGWKAPDVVGRVWRVRREQDVPGPAAIGDLADGTMAARATASVDGLLANLAHPSFRRRVAAQRELARRMAGDKAVIDRATKALLESPSERVRRHATWALAEARRGAGAELEPVIDNVFGWTIHQRTSDESGPAVDDTLAQVVRAVGQSTKPQGSFADALCELLPPMPDPVAAREAAIALGRLGDTSATYVMLDSLEHADDRFLRFAIRQALRALAQRPDFKFDLLLQKFMPLSSPATQQEIWLALRELHDARLADALATAASLETIAPEIRAGVLLTLASIEKKTAPWDGKWWETQPAKRPRPAKTETWEGTATVAAALERAFAAPQQPPAIRAALAAIVRESRNPALFPRLRAMAAESADAAERASLLALLAELRDADAIPLCRGDLAHADAPVRAAAATALAALAGAPSRGDLAPLLDDGDATVRRAAVLELSRWPRRDELGAYVAHLADAAAPAAVRDGCRNALVALRADVRADLEELATRGVLCGDALREVRSIYETPQPLLDWQLCGPFPREGGPADPAALAALAAPRVRAAAALPHGFVDLRVALAAKDHVSAFGLATIESRRARTATIVLGSDDGVTVWVNGQQVHQNLVDRGWGPEQDRFEVALPAGRSELMVRVDQSAGDWQFNVKVTDEPTGPLFDGVADARPAEIAFDLATWRAFALSNAGDATRGKALFHSESGPGCFRCHAIAGVGPKVGPDLRDVGKKYPRAELVTSILEPSQRIQDGYRAVNLFLADGDVWTGLVTAEANGQVTLVDATGRARVVAADQVTSRRESKLSAMPGGLAEPFTRQELADLVAWLETLRD